MERILIFVVLVCIVNVVLFFSVPDSSPYTFNLELILGEPWRILTFQFFHVNVSHLIENVIGFIVIAFIARELEVSFKNFLIAYFLSVFIVVLPLALIFPTVAVAGNSTGIYGALALCLIKARKLVSVKITLPFISLFIFTLSITNLLRCGMCFEKFFKGEFFHYIGFLTGMIVSFMPRAKVKHLLRV